MGLNAAMIEVLVAKGLSAQDILEVARASETRSDPTAAERKRRQREREKSQRDVTRDPPNDIYSNPPASSDEEAAARAKPEKRNKPAKPDVFPCPEGVDRIDWEALIANRKAKRAALTEGAHRQIVRKLENWNRDGWPPGPIVAFAAERGWTSVFETDEMKNGKAGQASAVSGSSFAQQILQQAERRNALTAQ